MNRIIPILIIILALVAAGCQAETTTPTPEEAVNMQPPEREIKQVPLAHITNILWQWAELIEKNPAAQSVVPDPENYTLSLWDDGTLGFKADCNNGGGSYTASNGQLEFGPMMTTLAMCPPDSLHDQYVALLGQIDTFGMADDMLVLTLKDDAGAMYFTNAGVAPHPSDPATETEDAAPKVKQLFVGPEKVDCVGVAPMECLLVKENPTDEWQMFYSYIEGFDWEPGYTYELVVEVHHVEDPPADASSLRYVLVEVVDKVSTPVESENGASYITISDPSEGDTIAGGEPVHIRGMGGGLFEGTVVVRILDGSGNELAMQPTIVQSPEAGIGGEGPWEVEISLTIDTPTPATITAFSPSPKDGEGWLASDEIAVQLAPGAGEIPVLENTPWLLRAYPQQPELTPVLDIVQVTANFDSDELTLTGTAGCNKYFTAYAVDGEKLTIKGPIGATRMMCPEPQMAAENAYLAALEQVSSYALACRDQMELRDGAGNPVLVFEVDPYTRSVSFTREELANTSYLNDFAVDGVIQLTNGFYSESAAAGSAAQLTVMLTNQAAFGDVTGDVQEDAVVVLVSQPGGSGSFYDLAVVRKGDGALTNTAHLQIGDRIQVKSMHIEDGHIVVDMLAQGPDDPLCCPTQYVSNTYAYQNGALTLINTNIVE